LGKFTWVTFHSELAAMPYLGHSVVVIMWVEYHVLSEQRVCQILREISRYYYYTLSIIMSSLEKYLCKPTGDTIHVKHVPKG
jgi:hypothetical protein